MVGHNRVFCRRSRALLGATFLVAATLAHGIVTPAAAEENETAVQSGSQGSRARPGNRMTLPDVSLPRLKRRVKTETADKIEPTDAKAAAKRKKRNAAKKKAAEKAKKAADKAKRKAARKAEKKTAGQKKRKQQSNERAAARAAAKQRAGKQGSSDDVAKTDAAVSAKADARQRARAKADRERARTAARRKAARKRERDEARRRAALEQKHNAWDSEVRVDDPPRVRPLRRRKPAYQSHPLPRNPSRRAGDRGLGAPLSERQLEETLTAPPRGQFKQRYSIDRVMRDHRLRSRLRRVDIRTINFRYDEADVPPGQIHKLRNLGRVLRRIVARRPWEVFLIEGHTDMPGRYEYNLDLSEERASAVKWILTDNYGIPATSLVTRGYGEQFPVVKTEEPERVNRRVSVRRITPLLRRGEAERRFRPRPYRRYVRPRYEPRPYRPYRPYRPPY